MIARAMTIVHFLVTVSKQDPASIYFVNLMDGALFKNARNQILFSIYFYILLIYFVSFFFFHCTFKLRLKLKKIVRF